MECNLTCFKASELDAAPYPHKSDDLEYASNTMITSLLILSAFETPHLRWVIRFDTLDLRQSSGTVSLHIV